MEENKRSDDKCWIVDTGKKKGGVCVILQRCKGCGYCIEFCPVQALKFSDKTTKRGYPYPEMVGGCILCGMCEKMCPEFSIYIKEE